MRHSFVNGVSALPPTPERNMLAAGIDIIPDKKNLGAKRAKRGECPTCGASTHKVPLFGKNKPLTIEGRVYKGRCLACDPLEGYIRRPLPNQQQHTQQMQMQQQQPQPQQVIQQQQQQQERAQAVPRTLEVGDEDDGDISVVSGITMDMRLIQGARHWNPSEGVDYDSDDVGQALPPPQRRPDASVGGDNPYTDSRPDPDHRPPRTMPSYSQSLRNFGAVGQSTRDFATAGRKHPPLPPSQNDPRFTSNMKSMLDKSENSMSSSGKSGPRGNGDRHFVSNGTGEVARRKSAHFQTAYADEYQRSHEYKFQDESADILENQDHVNYQDAVNMKPAAVSMGNAQALDADGYPVANSSYGWNKQADLLPPGGMEALFKNRTGTAAAIVPSPAPVSATISHQHGSSPPLRLANEIQFHPAQMALPTSAMPPLEDTKLPSINPHMLEDRIPKAPRAPSMESGPMYQSDDFPMYLQDNDTPMPRLVAQTSGPAFFSSARGDISRSLHSARSPPLLQAHKTAGPSSRRDGREHNGVGGNFAARVDSRRSAGSESTFAPPLINRNLRGRPDDDMIQDPMTNLTAPIGIVRPAASNIGHKDVHQPANNRYNSTLLPLHQRDAYERNNHHSSTVETDQKEPKKSDVFAGVEGADELVSTPMLQMKRAMYSATEAPIMNQELFEPASSSGQESYSYAPAASGGSPSPDRVSAMIRHLSIGNLSAPESTLPPRNRQGARDNTRRPQKDTIHDIPVILHCLNLDEATSYLREKALRSLSQILWTGGEKARDFIVQHKGIDTLVKAMWGDIGNAKVQDAAADFLLSLAASSDGRACNDMLSNEESFCDSLLFSMQMHASVQSIQLKGCGILSCLAAASSNNKNVTDGTLSGALMMVLNAMSCHSTSVEIQKAGLQALNAQCALSSTAESNKRSLMESCLDNGRSGIEVILSAMQCLQDDIVPMEWACRLCWCLTSSEDLVMSISGSPIVLQAVVEICQRHLRVPEASGLVEACFGVIGNLSHVESNRSELQKSNAVAMLIDGMRYHRKDYGVNIEACSAIGNAAVASSLRDPLIKSAGVEAVLHAMQSFMDSAEFVGEATRAMVCLSIHSQESKEAMALPEVIDYITHACSKHQDAPLLQEMSATLLASLAVGRGTSDVIIDNGGVDVLVWALSATNEEKVQDAAVAAYRNLSCQVQDADALLQKGAVKAIVKAMQAHENTVSIQINACCSLWNLAFKTKKEPGTLVGSEGIKCIVKAMQSHMESGDLLELACGALWSLVDDSIDRKKDVVGNGAIDAVACAVVMHPSRTSTLEKACGVLSNVSLEGPLAEAIANAQGVSIVVEAMRNNSVSISLLEVGCIVLRNIVFQFPDFAQEASGAISTIISAMRDNIDAVGFQQEACNLLWVLAAEAETCQSKILALDGISVLMECLEHNSDDPDVQDAALGAFNQLATNR